MRVDSATKKTSSARRSFSTVRAATPKTPGALACIGSSLLLLVLSPFAWSAPPASRGARPLALGQAYSSVAGDAYSLFYNPAGLAEIHQKEFTADMGRSFSIGESATSDFDGIYAMPYRYKDIYLPLAFSLAGQSVAESAHVVDFSVGGGADAPVDRWTNGKWRIPTRLGAAVTLRKQQGYGDSPLIGESSLGLGVTAGAYFPIDPLFQAAFVLKDLYTPGTNPAGPSVRVGGNYRYKGYLNIFADLEYASGGIWGVMPGLEWIMARGVIRPRLGWGYHDTDGVNTVAAGIGFNLSPCQFDFATLIPTRRASDNVGEYRFSLTYRFGTPQFSEVYYDRALEAAGRLDQNVLQLTVKEAEVKASLAELEQKRRMAKEELENSKARIEALKSQDLLGQRDTKIRHLEERVRDLEGQVSYHRNDAGKLRQKEATIRTHVVKPGDTLQSLAQEYYGDPNQWKKIFNANTEKIERGLPKPGEKLVIP